MRLLCKYLSLIASIVIIYLVFCVVINTKIFREIDDKPEGDLSVQVHAINRLNQKKKIGRCNITTSKLEDGKALETWYSFSKKKRKGSMKSKGYLKVKVMWISAVV